jgi:hypothetical protein
MKTELFSVFEISRAYKIHPKKVLQNIKKLNLTPYKNQGQNKYYFDRKQVFLIINYSDKPKPDTPYVELVTDTWYVFPSRMNWDKNI